MRLLPNSSPLPLGGGGCRWASLSQSSPFPLGRGRTKVGDRNFLPQCNPLLVFLPLKKGEEIERGERERIQVGLLPKSSPSLWEGEDTGGGGVWNLEFRLEFRI